MRFSFFLFVSLSACGGAIDTGLLDGGGGSDASTDSAPNDSQTSDAAPSCDDLLNQLTTETPAAEKCCPTCDIVQCTTQVDGLCCPISVSVATSDAVKAYEATLAQIKQAQCEVMCPAIACSTQPSGECGASGTCNQ